MVHALKETHRDLRPAPAHRRLGLGEGRRWRPVGALHETLDDDHAADAAVATVVQDGYFRPEKRLRFQLDRAMDTMEEIREWLSDFDQRRALPVHTPLLERLERRRARLETSERIVVRGPMKLGVLRKLNPMAPRTR
jgi:hypothetical protein